MCIPKLSVIEGISLTPCDLMFTLGMESDVHLGIGMCTKDSIFWGYGPIVFEHRFMWNENGTMFRFRSLFFISFDLWVMMSWCWRCAVAMSLVPQNRCMAETEDGASTSLLACGERCLTHLLPAPEPRDPSSPTESSHAGICAALPL